MLRDLYQDVGSHGLLGLPEVGIDAATIISQTATGDNGPGLLHDAALANPGTLIRLEITQPLTAGTLFINEDGSFTIDFTGADEGYYTLGYNEIVNNTISRADTADFTVGNVAATAPGATLNGPGTLTPGTATGNQNATAPGATLTDTSTLSPGTATGNSTVNATAPGATLTDTSTLTPGTATGNQNATAPGTTLTDTSTLSPGAATGDQSSSAPGTTLSGPGALTPGQASSSTMPVVDTVIHTTIARIAGVELGLPPASALVVGETVRLPLQVTDILGDEIDPTALILKIKAPNSAPYTPSINKVATGQYYVDLLLDKPGRWYYRAESSAPGPAVSEGAFVVQPSRF